MTQNCIHNSKPHKERVGVI
jgi:cell division cycle 20-like protein 1 (cofactor of APC complex)